MSAFAGTGRLFRLALRRSRVLIGVWLAVFVVMAAGSASATVDLYPTLADRVAAAETINRSQAVVAFYGRIYDPTSIGAISMIKMGGLGAVFVAMLAVVLVVRHTRADEEAGRTELVRGAATSRPAPLAAALLVVLVTNGALALLTALALAATGLPLAGSVAFGLAWAGVGLAFGAIAAVAVQLTVSARGATSLSAAVLAVVYVVRAVGDAADASGPRWLSWLSPIGWGQQFRPFAGNRWWVLLITIGFTVVVSGLALVVADRRDLGTGVLPVRAGRPEGAPSLAGPVALAWRLDRGALVGWSIGFAMLGGILGNMAGSVGDFVTSSSAQDFITRLGGEKALVDAYLSLCLGMGGLVAAAFGVSMVSRLRTEEAAGRAEPVLATSVGRLRWARGQLLVAVGGTTLLMVLVGLSAGLARAASGGEAADVGRLLAASLVRLPAVWVPLAVTVTAFGLVPRMTAAVGWATLAGFVLLGELGPLLKLSHWVLDLSPFTHVPQLPGVALTVTPLAVLCLLVAVLGAVGLAGLRRRDVG